MKKFYKTPLATAMGAALISTFASTGVNAETSPFAISELSSGYMQLAEGGKEMTCGDKMKMDTAPSVKTPEKKCAGMKLPNASTELEVSKPPVESKTPLAEPEKPVAAVKKTAADGKCGQGTCAVMMDGDKMKSGQEKSCGAMMKGKEGACGNVNKSSVNATEAGVKAVAGSESKPHPVVMRSEEAKAKLAPVVIKSGDKPKMSGMDGMDHSKSMENMKDMDHMKDMGNMKDMDHMKGMEHMKDMDHMKSMEHMKCKDGSCGDMMKKMEASHGDQMKTVPAEAVKSQPSDK